MDKQFFVYILNNKANTVLYTGVTSDLRQRIFQHKEKQVEGFTKRYNLDRLVYYELFSDARSAISREKQIKNYSRRKKMELIDTMNPKWEDLYNNN